MSFASSDKAMIYVILLNWNHWQLTAACIHSLWLDPSTQLGPKQIVVVDNGSQDNSVANLRREFGDTIVLLENATNLGYAGGNNVGIRYALAEGATSIMVLNNDTLVKPNFFGPLLERLASD